MSSVILTILNRIEVAASLLGASGRLAELSGAGRISALTVRVPPIETIMPTEEVLTHEREARIRTEEEHRLTSIKAIFDTWAARQSAVPISGWQEVEGHAESIVTERGRSSDFLVMQRPPQRRSEFDREVVRAALFGTDRPVLMVPAAQRDEQFGRRVAIAWRGDVRTIKAVLAMLRCLRRSEQIDILVGTRNGAQWPRVPEIFGEHGVCGRLHVLEISGQKALGKTLLAKAQALGSDMLVMDAFARHPLRTLVLGGVTRHVLAHAELPVLARH